jgi:RNA polymerase sigma factor (TIGR02999 family)
LNAPALPNPSLTVLLQDWRNGSGTAFESLFDQAYEHLKAIAIKRLGRFGGSPTMSATELLHEALVGIIPSQMEWKDRAHFFATMSLAMRSVLVDHVRAKSAEKRGGSRVRVTLDDATAIEEENVVDMLALDQALSKLETLDPRGAAVVHLTYFTGLDRAEIADVLQTSVTSVDRDLRFARGWLRVELRDAV